MKLVIVKKGGHGSGHHGHAGRHGKLGGSTPGKGGGSGDEIYPAYGGKYHEGGKGPHGRRMTLVGTNRLQEEPPVGANPEYEPGRGSGGSVLGSNEFGRHELVTSDVFREEEGGRPQYGVHSQYLKPRTSKRFGKVMDFANKVYDSGILNEHDGSIVYSLVSVMNDVYSKHEMDRDWYEIEAHRMSSIDEAMNVLNLVSWGHYKKNRKL